MTTEAETHTMMMMMLFVLNGDNDDREENRKMWILHITGADMTTNRIPTFFRVFRFPHVTLTAEKSYLIDNFGEKGGLLHRCRDTTAVAFCSSLGFFSAGKKAEKLQHAEFEANLQMALSLSLTQKRAEHFHFSWQWKHLAYFHPCILLSEIQNLSSPVPLLFCSRRLEI